MNKSGSSFLTSVTRMIDEAFERLDLPPGLFDQIRTCNAV